MSYVVMSGFDPNRFMQDVTSGNVQGAIQDVTGGGQQQQQSAPPQMPAKGFFDQQVMGLPMPLVLVLAGGLGYVAWKKKLF